MKATLTLAGLPGWKKMRKQLSAKDMKKLQVQMKLIRHSD